MFSLWNFLLKHEDMKIFKNIKGKKSWEKLMIKWNGKFIFKVLNNWDSIKISLLRLKNVWPLCPTLLLLMMMFATSLHLLGIFSKVTRCRHTYFILAWKP